MPNWARRRTLTKAHSAVGADPPAVITQWLNLGTRGKLETVVVEVSLEGLLSGGVGLQHTPIPLMINAALPAAHQPGQNAGVSVRSPRLRW